MPRRPPPNDRAGDHGGWMLVSNNAMHQAQAKEFLDFLAPLYGRAFAEDAVQKAVKQAVAEGDDRPRLPNPRAARIPKPDYVREHEAHFRKDRKGDVDERQAADGESPGGMVRTLEWHRGRRLSHGSGETQGRVR